MPKNKNGLFDVMKYSFHSVQFGLFMGNMTWLLISYLVTWHHVLWWRQWHKFCSIMCHCLFPLVSWFRVKAQTQVCLELIYSIKATFLKIDRLKIFAVFTLKGQILSLLKALYISHFLNNFCLEGYKIFLWSKIIKLWIHKETPKPKIFSLLNKGFNSFKLLDII